MYAHPKDPGAFEQHYRKTHVPLVTKTQGIIKAEYTKFLPDSDGSQPAYYRMAELYFAGPAEMQQALSSPEGQAMAADLSNVATGGVTILFGAVES